MFTFGMGTLYSRFCAWFSGSVPFFSYSFLVILLLLRFFFSFYFSICMANAVWFSLDFAKRKIRERTTEQKKKIPLTITIHARDKYWIFIYLNWMGLISREIGNIAKERSHPFPLYDCIYIELTLCQVERNAHTAFLGNRSNFSRDSNIRRAAHNSCNINSNFIPKRCSFLIKNSIGCRRCFFFFFSEVRPERLFIHIFVNVLFFFNDDFDTKQLR